MFFSFGNCKTDGERKALVEREQKEQKEREIERRNKIKETRLANLKKARETRLLRQQLEQLEKDALIELIVKLRKENEKLETELGKKCYEVVAAERQGYRQAQEDRYNSLSQKEKGDIQWERDRASDRLVN